MKILLPLFLSVILPSCGSLNQLMKAKPCKPAGSFVDFRATPKKQTKRSPWHYAAYATDPAVLRNANQHRKLYVAPVRVSDLRPISKKLAATEYSSARKEHAAEIASVLRQD